MLPKKLSTDELLRLNPKIIFEWIKNNNWKYSDFEEWYNIQKQNTSLLEEKIAELTAYVDYLDIKHD